MNQKLLPLALLVAALTGCASNVPLHRDQIGRISAETSPTELNNILGKATISAEYDFEAQSRAYRARHLSLQTGTQQSATVVCTPTCIPIMIDVPVLAQYVLVQEQPSLKLVGWGTIEELSKSPENRIASLMPDLKKSLEQFNNNKKK